MNKREAYRATQDCPRVVDDFGALGRVVGWTPDDDSLLLVRWDGEATLARVHHSRVHLAEESAP
jgi:hypothetical protein